MSIYTNYDGTTVSGLLATTQSNTLIANQWNDMPSTSASITSGNTYYICFNSQGSSTGFKYFQSNSGTSIYFATGYGPFPTSFSKNGDITSTTFNLRMTYSNPSSAPVFFANRSTNTNIVYDGTTQTYFNISWVNVTDQIYNALINLDGTNYTMSQIQQNSTATDYGFNIVLGAGNHYFIMYGNTTASLQNNTVNITFAISKATPSTPSITFSPTSPITYGISDTATATVTSAMNLLSWTLWRDNTTNVGSDGTSIAETQTWGVGTKLYCVNTTGNANYSSSVGVCSTLTINKATPSTPSITFSPISPITYPTSDTATATVSSINNLLNWNWYRDNTTNLGTITTTGTDTNTWLPGTKNYCVNTTGNANYTSSTGICQTLIIIQSPLIIKIISPLNISYGTNTILWNETVSSILNSTVHVVVYDDGAIIYNNFAQSNVSYISNPLLKSMGTHNLTVWALDVLPNATSVIYTVTTAPNITTTSTLIPFESNIINDIFGSQLFFILLLSGALALIVVAGSYQRHKGVGN
jgi:hypothetical protein